MRRAALILGVLSAAGALPAPAPAQESDPNCLEADPPAVGRPAHPLRFGITPGAAGSVGATQGAVAPENEDAALSALRDLRPGRRALVLRLNRLFWADGEPAIERFAGLVDRYAAAGFESESQVRYHPPQGAEGDIDGWERFVRAAARELGRRPALVALSITNEGNYDGSANTSDGAYDGVVDALVRGIVAAREELDAIGRRDVELGFSVMWRWRPDGDRRFWEEIGAKATPAFRAALGYVGLQVYPGLVWPPAPLPGRTAGDEIVEAMTLLRRCYMPKAGLGDEVDAWVTENGYATNLGRTETSQSSDLESTVEALHAYSGELGISDYRWFNLRDNDSDGADLFDAVGLLRDDYARKPAFATYRGLVDAHGVDDPAPVEGGPGGEASPAPLPPRRRAVRLRWRVTPRSDRRGARRFVTSGRLSGAQGACGGAVVIRFRAGRRTIALRRARVGTGCRFRSAVVFRTPRRFRRRARLTVLARFDGTRLLAPTGGGSRRVRVA